MEDILAEYGNKEDLGWFGRIFGDHSVWAAGVTYLAFFSIQAVFAWLRYRKNVRERFILDTWDVQMEYLREIKAQENAAEESEV